MRLQKFMLNELSSLYGKGITFLDVDETLMNTFAKIYVIKNNKIVKKLSNQEFNTYKLQPDESFDFKEFADADLFYNTSKPIFPTINRVKRIFKNIDRRGSKVVLLTARREFKDLEKFKKTFSDYGIPINDITIEFNKNTGGSVSDNKKHTIFKYLYTGDYRRVRLIDDSMDNIRKFISIENEIPQEIINKVKMRHRIEDEESINPIEIYGLLVRNDGSLVRVK